MIRTTNLIACLLAVGLFAQSPSYAAASNGGGWGNGCNGKNGKNDHDNDGKGKNKNDKDCDGKGKGKNDKDKDCDGKGKGKGGHGHDHDGGGCGGGGGGGNCNDTVPPVIECPELFKLFCGDSTAPENTGFPVVTDDTDPAPAVTYCDSVQTDFCGADRYDRVITRTWKAKDKCGNVATCAQTIHVVKNVLNADILPGVCPNTFVPNCQSLPITILGTDDFNVSTILPGSVRVYLDDCVGGPVAPKAVCYGDVGGVQNLASECGCDVVGPDGRNDATFYFSKALLDCRFGLSNLPSGTTVRLTISGKLCNGCEFIAVDCLVIP